MDLDDPMALFNKLSESPKTDPDKDHTDIFSEALADDKDNKKQQDGLDKLDDLFLNSNGIQITDPSKPSPLSVLEDEKNSTTVPDIEK